MIRYIGIVVMLLFMVSSCEDSVISDGRKAYKQYFKNTLKDPESLKVHSEAATKTGDNTVTFIVDYGAKNSFGAYVRETVTFETVDNRLLKVDGKIYVESSNSTTSSSMKLEPLALKEGLYGTSYINRTLLLHNNKFIEITPTIISEEKRVYLIVKSSLENSGFGTKLTFTFLDGDDLILEASTDTNSDKSYSYYNLTKGQIEALKNKDIKRVLIEKGSSSFYCDVDNNQQTYFKEYFGLKEIEQIIQAIK